MNTNKNSILKQLSPDTITRNPDNPRLYFRSEEMDALLSSIGLYGIQVPITVYQSGEDYVLIDGERRWRCARKLNLKSIPALVQPEPTKLNNLLLMFNIHALREQWDYVTIAAKLPIVIQLFVNDNGKDPTEAELSEITGLARGQIRRCRLLLNLPKHYMEMLLNELEKPKSKQRLSEDFFIEMERALRAINNRIPDAIANLDDARSVLIDKFLKKVIDNATDFRKLSKIATSVSNLGVEQDQAIAAVQLVVAPNNKIGIDDVFAEQFETIFDERRLTLHIRSIVNFLSPASTSKNYAITDQKLIDELLELRDAINDILEEL